MIATKGRVLRKPDQSVEHFRFAVRMSGEWRKRLLQNRTMKTHQILAIVATMVIAMTGAAFSADADKVVTYEVGMTGVT